MSKKECSKRIVIVGILLMLAGFLLLLFAVRPVCYSVSKETETVRRTIAKTGRIVHAGGYVQIADGEQVRYTNSFEALTNMYAKGNRVCEIDIRETSDGILICAHGDEFFLADGTDLPVNTTAEEFLSEPLFGSLQPMTVQMLADFMREHDDLLIITDIRGNNVEICKKLAEEYPDLKTRFLIQIYQKEEYFSIYKLGFPFIIYTLYREEDSERNLWKIAHFAQSHELVAVTIQADQYFGTKNRIAMNHSGVPYMFHTVDDTVKINEMLRKPYVLGVYTDLTDLC